MPASITLQRADGQGDDIEVEAHPQTAVMPGEAAGTALLILPDGSRRIVEGDAKEIQIRIQAAAAQGHESGDAPRKNTSMS
jgi:hypothetical protein